MPERKAHLCVSEKDSAVPEKNRKTESLRCSLERKVLTVSLENFPANRIKIGVPKLIVYVILNALKLRGADC